MTVYQMAFAVRSVKVNLTALVSAEARNTIFKIEDGVFASQILFHNSERDSRRGCGIVIDPVRLLLEILLICCVDIAKSLRVAVDEREPRRLYLDHQAVTGTNRMQRVRKSELHFGHFSGLEWLVLLEAIPELATEDIPSDELLVAAHLYLGGVRIEVGEVIRINIDHLHDPIGIGTGSGDVEFHLYWTCDCQIVLHDAGLVDEHIGATRGEALIGRHIFLGHTNRRFVDVWDWLCRVTDILICQG